MKNLKLFLMSAMLLLAVACNNEKAPKVLVLYFSQNGSTKAVAEEIQARLGADIEAIVPVNAYDGDYAATIARSREEREGAVLPELQPLASDISSYDIIFLGYPIWFGTYAQPLATLLANQDFAGKKVVPFCTFGSGGLDASVKDIAEKLPGAQVLPGYGVRAARIAAAPAEIDMFLKENGFIKGDFTPLQDFPEQHPASEEEAAIFDAAVGGYPMIKAMATMVSSREIPGGTEYLFTAVNLPREDMPDMPASEIKVYVRAVEGQTPEFTQVVR